MAGYIFGDHASMSYEGAEFLEGDSYSGTSEHFVAGTSIGRRNANDGTTSCLACAKAKKKCSGERPCTRCVAYGKEAQCVDAPRNYKRILFPSTTATGAASPSSGSFSSTHESTSQLSLVSHFRQPSPKVILAVASPAGVDAWSSATGLSYAFWDDARIRAALPTGLPYIDSEAFAALWKTVAPGALRPDGFLDECVDLDDAPGLPQEALRRGIVPIPEDYLQSIMTGMGLDTSALAAAACAPQWQQLHSPLLMHWEAMTHVCAEAALEASSVPAARVVFAASRFVPKRVFGNSAFQALIGVNPAILLQTVQAYDGLHVIHPVCALPRLLAALDMRNRRVRQSKFRGLYLRHIPPGPGDSPAMNYHSRTFEATELLRADYSSNGSLRSVTIYFTDIRHRYSDFVGNDYIRNPDSCVFLIHDAPDDFVEVAQASSNLGIGSSVLSVGMQPGFDLHPVEVDPRLELPANLVHEGDSASNNVQISRKTVILRGQGFAKLPNVRKHGVVSGLSLLMETEAKIAALRKPALDALVDSSCPSLLPQDVLYHSGPTAGIEMQFGRERVIAVPDSLHNALLHRMQGRPAQWRDIVDSTAFSSRASGVEALNVTLEGFPSSDALSSRSSGALSNADVHSNLSASQHMSPSSASSATYGCTPRVRISAHALCFSCTCASVEYRCSVDTLGAPFVTWAARHKAQLTEETAMSFHSAVLTSVDALECESFECVVAVPVEYIKQTSRSLVTTDESIGPDAAFVQLTWRIVNEDGKASPQGPYVHSSTSSPVSHLDALASPQLCAAVSASTYLW